MSKRVKELSNQGISNSNFPVLCPVCSTKHGDQVDLDAHMTGKKHRKMVAAASARGDKAMKSVYITRLGHLAQQEFLYP